MTSQDALAYPPSVIGLLMHVADDHRSLMSVSDRFEEANWVQRDPYFPGRWLGQVSAVIPTYTSMNGVLQNLYLHHAHFPRTTTGVGVQGKIWAVVGIDDDHERQAASTLFECRRITGLSWQLLADLLGVSRRTLHQWVAGGKINLENRKRLGSLLAALRRIDQGSAEKNQDLLFSPALDGKTVFDLLADTRFFEVVALVPTSAGRRTDVHWAKVSDSTHQKIGPEPLSAQIDRYSDNGGLPEQVILAVKPKLRRLKTRRR